MFPQVQLLPVVRPGQEIPRTPIFWFLPVRRPLVVKRGRSPARKACRRRVDLLAAVELSPLVPRRDLVDRGDRLEVGHPRDPLKLKDHLRCDFSLSLVTLLVFA